MTYEEELLIFMKRTKKEREVIYDEMYKTESYQGMAELEQKLKKLQKSSIKNIVSCGENTIFRRLHQ